MVVIEIIGIRSHTFAEERTRTDEDGQEVQDKDRTGEERRRQDWIYYRVASLFFCALYV